MSTNTLSIEERVKAGKEKEQLIFKLLRERQVWHDGEQIISWKPATDEEDIHDKIDAWAETETRLFSVQFKYRDVGADLGIAAVRPFEHDLFKMDWAAGEGCVRWDRDMKNKVDIIVCLADYNSKLIVANGHTVHKAVKTLLGKLAEEEVFYARRYTVPGMKGGTIQVMRDKGEGYSSGQQKLVVYLESWLFKGDKGQVFNVG